MERVYIKTKRNGKWFSVSREHYSDLYNNEGRGFINDTCFFKYREQKECFIHSFILGCYYIEVMPKDETNFILDYDKGVLSFDTEEVIIGDLKQGFLIEEIETEKVKIRVEFY